MHGHHKHFTWTGPKLQILPRSDEILTIISVVTCGEMKDLPRRQIYIIDVDSELPPSTDVMSSIGKRCDQADDANPSDEMPRKQQRLL